MRLDNSHLWLFINKKIITFKNNSERCWCAERRNWISFHLCMFYIPWYNIKNFLKSTINKLHNVVRWLPIYFFGIWQHSTALNYMNKCCQSLLKPRKTVLSGVFKFYLISTKFNATRVQTVLITRFYETKVIASLV